tara:strand:+ start:2485 stop:2835 length:351 start_codon:yes stop_codon:yes gene_type:complete
MGDINLIRINGKDIKVACDLEDYIIFKNEGDLTFSKKELARCIKIYHSLFGHLPLIGHNFYILFPEPRDRDFLNLRITGYTTYNDMENVLLVFTKLIDCDGDFVNHRKNSHDLSQV